MLNQYLYDSLIKLGIDELTARKAAEESSKLDSIKHDLNGLRESQYQMHRQVSEVNDRTIKLEKISEDILSILLEKNQK